jgi:hypothetical protein
MARRPQNRPIGQRTSLPPNDLHALTDSLVANPTSILLRLGIDPRIAIPQSVAPHLVYRWIDILEDARDLERKQAPTLGQCLRGGGALAVGVLGVGFAFTAPIFGFVVATVGLVVGGASGAFAVYDAADIVRRDLRSGERLRAIDAALGALRGLLS